LIVAYGYSMEAFFAFYSGNPYEKFMFMNRAFGDTYGWSYWLLIATNILIPQLLWIRAFVTTRSYCSCSPSTSWSECGSSVSLSW
jgi:molybdopterin-containing oxidoreductase family membrane subunit